MKKIIYILFLLSCAFAGNAQSITPTSTASECISFIQSVAQIYKGTPDIPVIETKFDGNSFIQKSGGGSQVFKKAYKGIDWTQFENFSSSPLDGKILAMFFFKTKTISRELSETGPTPSFKEEAKHVFSFSIPENEQAQLKYLEIASKRLAQLGKEGAIFGFSNSIKSIEGFPSYAETVNYIQSYFADPFFRDGKRFNGGYSVVGVYHKNSFKIIDIDFSDCNMTIKYETKVTVMLPSGFQYDPPKIMTATIDFSQVESMSIWNSGNDGYSVYGLAFNIKGKGTKQQMELPFARMEVSSSNIETLKNEKIYKAFNHLRKLCGAPEPIQF